MTGSCEIIHDQERRRANRKEMKTLLDTKTKTSHL